MIFLKLSKFSELLLTEVRKTGRQYLQVNSCSRNGGCNLGCLIGYRFLAIDVLGMNDKSVYYFRHITIMGISHSNDYYQNIKNIWYFTQVKIYFSERNSTNNIQITTCVTYGLRGVNLKYIFLLRKKAIRLVTHNSYTSQS